MNYGIKEDVKNERTQKKLELQTGFEPTTLCVL